MFPRLRFRSLALTALRLSSHHRAIFPSCIADTMTPLARRSASRRSVANRNAIEGLSPVSRMVSSIWGCSFSLPVSLLFSRIHLFSCGVRPIGVCRTSGYFRLSSPRSVSCESLLISHVLSSSRSVFFSVPTLLSDLHKSHVSFLPVLLKQLVVYQEFFGLFSPGSREPVPPFRHDNLKPGTRARLTVLGDRDTGDR